MKKLSLILFFVLIMGSLAGCGNGASSSSPSQAPQEESGGGASFFDGKTKLVMGTEASFAPYEYYDDSGKVVGVDPDIANAIAESLGIELEIAEMEFSAIIPEVKSGRVDFGAAGMTIDPERSLEVDFSIPYATSKQIIVIRNDNNSISGPDDLADKTVGVQMGTVADYELSDNYPDTEVKQYNKYFEAMSDLVNGRLDAIVMDILPAQEFVSKNPELVIVEKELMTDEYAICVQKGNTELLEAINGALKELIDSGKVDEFTMNHTVSE